MEEDNTRNSMLGRTRSFFGVNSNYSVDEVESWNQRRLKFCVNKFGNLNYEKMKPESDLNQSLMERVTSYAPVETENPDEAIIRPTQANLTFASLGPNRRVNRSKTGVSWLQKSLVTPHTSMHVDNNEQMIEQTLDFASYNETAVINEEEQTEEVNFPRKKHAFAAIANVVRESIRRQGQAKSANELKEPTMPSISIEMRLKNIESSSSSRHSNKPILEAVNIPRESQEARTHKSNLSRRSWKQRSLKWSNSVVERAHHRIKKLDVRRRFTDSFIGKLFCCVTPTANEDTRHLKQHISDLPQYRPYFTYWVCMLQLLLFIVTLIVYGLAPLDLDFVSKVKAEVVMPSASFEQACRQEYVNLFIGPRKADLIRMGARYSPCMRYDANIDSEIIQRQRKRDELSGCCIRNDGGGCYQTSRFMCSTTLATWRFLRKDQVSRVVCGLDPEFCDNPKSMPPFVWQNSMLEWPICRKVSSTNLTNGTDLSNNVDTSHMTCEISGRPCCIGSKGECVVTTRQHCTFLRGYYHPEASFCSQVDCMGEICGMISLSSRNPYQFYRFFTALFISPSLGSLVVILAFQLSVMRDLEKMAGWHRIAIIYLLSGIIGNLTSGVFLPYQVQCGPSGSIFALLAMTFTEFIQSWPLIDKPIPVLIKFLFLGFFLFFMGFLPFFDNYAHLSGLLSGILLSFILLPFLGMPTNKALEKLLASQIQPMKALEKFQQKVQHKRVIIICCCSLLWLGGLVSLVLLFYLYPVTSCRWCKYLNCIPLIPHFCDNMDVNVTTKTACVIKA